ncbi:ABC transporter ATP-binding protein [Gammaproteobacteria bacterium]|nr:ABC transporter ATP-binding protein [Gammaproteobacteria bacterium]
MNPVIDIQDLWVEARSSGANFHPIVEGVSVSVHPGEVVALIGESGSGKTTTALSAMAYSKPGCRIVGGSINLNGRDLLELTQEERRQLRGREVAYVAQSAAAAFNPAIKIGDQVIESTVIHDLMPRDEALRRAVEMYQRLDLPEPGQLSNRYPHQVSGGQLQRLMAAMAMSSSPSLLILDEPTTALDVTTQIAVLSAFKDLIKGQNTAAIYVTHDLAVVAQIADRIIVMQNGKTMETGPTDEIISRPQNAYTQTLMAAVRPSPKSMSFDGTEHSQAVSDSVIRVNSLTAGYGRVKKKIVLQDVSLDVPRGQVVGVIGESGCGKSTLARVIAGLLPQISGEIYHHGEKLRDTAKHRTRDVLKNIQIVFQMPDVAINPRHRVREILGRPLDLFMGLDGSARESRIDELLELVELPASYKTRLPGELSGGEKQRINLARALAAEPELILCDEVTSALDTVVGKAIIDLLKKLQANLGVAYLFISHDLSTVASFADQVVVLYAGRVVEQGSLASVLAPPFHPYTRLLLGSVPELRTDWLDGVVASKTHLDHLAQSVEGEGLGCPFFNRCASAVNDVCNSYDPPLRKAGAGHTIACHVELDALSEQYH